MPTRSGLVRSRLTKKMIGPRRKLLVGLTAVAICGAIAMAFGAGRVLGQSQPTFSLPAIDLPKTAPPATQQPAVSAGSPDKQEIAKEADELLRVANDLKVEVDKTTQDTLSLSVVRKAGAIEQMAHKDRTGIAKEVGQR